MTEEEVTQMMRNQVYINVPNYGTRTHTLIMVDDENRATYREYTMKCPIDSNDPVWIETNFEFNI